MIKTSTLSSLQSPQTKVTEETVSVKEDQMLPEFEGPSESTINNILNYSKSLTIMQSEMVREIEVVKS